MKTIIQWLTTNKTMFINASSLVGTTAITSGLGFVYWWVAARWFPPESIGLASAAISAMMLLGGASVLGLGTLLITELPRQPGMEGSLISTALLVVGAVGSIIGLLFALIASHLSPGFRPLDASILDAFTFAGGVGLFAITLVLDQALIGLLRGEIQFWRNALFAIVKLLVLFVVGFWPSSQEGVRIYATWAIATLPSLGFICFHVVARKNWRSKSYWPQWRLLRTLGFAALQHHMLNLTLQAPTLLLPMLVTVLLSAKMNAWFYMAWMIVSFVFIVPGALTTVLHAMNSAQQATLGHKARLTISIALIVTILANVVLQLGSQQLLGLFGKTYATEANWSLRILVIAAFPLIIKNHYISFCRIQDRIISAMMGMLPGGLLELGMAAVGAHVAGLLGLCTGWVIAISIEAACMLPTVYKVLRSASTPESREPYSSLANQEIYQQTTASLAIPEHGYLDIDNIWRLDTLILPVMKTPSLKKPENLTPPPGTPPVQEGVRLKPLRLQRFESPLDVQ